MREPRFLLRMIGPSGTASALVPAEGQLTIGRSHECDIHIEDSRVSRLHALIHCGVVPSFEDLGSKNGSALRRGTSAQRVSARTRTDLAEGDVVALGSSVLVVHRLGDVTARMVSADEEFETYLAEACERASADGERFTLIRVQLQALGLDLAQSVLHPLGELVDHITCSAVGMHEMLLLSSDPEGAADLRHAIMSHLGEREVNGDIALAIYPDDGRTAGALLAVANVALDTLPAASTAPAPPDRPKRQLPGPLTSFVGRDTELERLARLFADGARLVTLAGPPGVGKTRLALRHAELSECAHVRLCELAVARGLADLCALVARTLDVELDPIAEPAVQVEHLARNLAERDDLLLVLDECEHVASEVAHALVRWTAVATGVRFLVTSREIIGVGGEQAVEIGPLGLPRDDDDTDADAVRLFRDRARLVQDGGDWGADQHAVIALVRELDGLPLALELASGCLDVFGPADLLARLPRRLDDLTEHGRGHSGRHHSLRTAIDGSWALLRTWEQDTLLACVLFHGGFSLDAVEAVVDVTAVVDAPRAAQVIASLRRKSLLRGFEPAETRGHRRFAFYESIRAYVDDKLDASGRRDELASRHAAYFAGLAAKAVDPAATNVTERDRMLELELENLRSAHRYAIAKTPPDLDTALTIAVALEHSLATYGRLGDLLALLDEPLARLGDAPADPGLVVRAQVARATTRHYMGRGDVREDLEAALATSRQLGNVVAEAKALASLAQVEYVTDASASLRWFDAALPKLRATGDVAREALLLLDLASAQLALGELDERRRLLDEAARCAERAGDKAAEVHACVSLGNLLFSRDRSTEAEEVLHHAIDLAKQSGGARAEAHASQSLASLLQERGCMDEAATHYQHAYDVFRRIGARLAAGRVTGAMASLLHETGKLEQARARYDEAIGDLRDTELRGTETTLRAARGAVTADLDRIEEAEACFANVTGQLGTGVDARRTYQVEMLHAHVDLARARRAATDGELEVALALRSQVGLVLARVHKAPLGVGHRVAQRLLKRACIETDRWLATPGHDAADRQSPLLRVGHHGRWLILPSGARVELGRHPALRRIVLALAERRRDGADDGLSSTTLLGYGWPGERVDPLAGNARVRVALSRLRSLGLRELLIRADNGYALAPHVTVEIESGTPVR